MAIPVPTTVAPRRAGDRRRAVHGFSLVESAVVLVIVGLALAAVLQGRELIAGAEYRALRHQLGEQRDAFHAFRERYHALPGDFAAARARLGVAPGNGDGIIGAGAACAGAGDESCRAWQHLRAAGLLAGDPRPPAGRAPGPSLRRRGGRLLHRRRGQRALRAQARDRRRAGRGGRPARPRRGRRTLRRRARRGARCGSLRRRRLAARTRHGRHRPCALSRRPAPPASYAPPAAACASSAPSPAGAGPCSRKHTLPGSLCSRRSW
ncbi:MAG: type II secretion system protein [Halofilum sp. (in: g-proteobacteria)]|nr:type II secretion system protein [Halofilum sp. (in: g-proteobacteria)]